MARYAVVRLRRAMKPPMVQRRKPAFARVSASMAALLPLALASAPAAAQSHAVVQPLPPAATGDLTDALARLARNGSDFNALIDAGNASLELDDIDAAVGFFGRADELRPGDARVKAGLATAALRSDRPLDAITQFDQAVSAGVDPVSVASDRGLAYDLVGDNASAQAQYRLALSRRADDDTIRRLALSLAISGDKDGFEKTLLPLLQKRDFGAYRVRAMGLAILGRKDEATSIAEAVMPRDLAAQMLPYLDYMPRLTRAQQAAAANLGKFPRAAQIGRDDPRFAQYSPPASQPKVASAGSVDSRLTPTGQPLGPRSKTDQPASKAVQPSKPTPAEARRLAREQDRGIRRSRPSLEGATMKRAAPPPPPPPPASTPPSPTPASTPQASGSVELPPVSGNPKPGFDLATVASQPASQLDNVRQAQAQTPSRAPVTITPAPRNATPVSDAPAVQPFTASTPPPAPSPPLALPQESRPIVQPTPPPPPPSVADAFAELTLPQAPSQAATGAVDITAIKIKRELPPPPPPPPAPPPPPPPPPEPSRIWVQVATGKDLKALAFDWRRFGKQAPKVLAKRDAFTVEWGQSRRLVTGPFASNKEADAAIADLKALGIDSFRFTSEKGEKVSPLK